MSRKVFHCVASLILALAVSFAGFAPVLAAPPFNDNFADATVVSTLPFSDIVDITEATLEPDEPQPCWTGTVQTVWYSFTPTSKALIQVWAWNSSGDNIINIYQATGSGFDNLNFKECQTWGSPAVFTVEAGTTYYIQAGIMYSSGGELTLNLIELPRPANDDFANATIIGDLPFNDVLDYPRATTEPGEPWYCEYSSWTVWYSYTPANDAVLRVDMEGSSFWDTTFAVYRSDGTGFGGLSLVNCASWGGSINVSVQADVTYYIQAGSIYNNSGELHLNVQQIPPPPNDNFANAKVIPSPLPFDDSIDATAAGRETGEPKPSCASDSWNQTAWYAYTPGTSGSITASIPWANFAPVLAVYTGNSLNNLQELKCSLGENVIFHVDAGVTYYFQVSANWNDGGPVAFRLDVTPPPAIVWLGFNPSDPSVFDNIQFNQESFDPANVGIESYAWNFGDGATATGRYPIHRYSADGDYTLQFTVTTYDGRTASNSQVVHVKTHDVAITKITAPQSAKAGQAQKILIEVKNRRYPEYVQVELYKSVPGGFQWVGSYTQYVPVRTGNQTSTFTFNYTFTKDDATQGKVTFKAVANIVSYRDALPADNELISSPPTKVTR